MGMDEIYKTVSSDKIYSADKKHTADITEKDIFDDDEDNLNTANTKDNFDITDEDIFGEDTKVINMMCRISELEKQNSVLIKENAELRQQLQDLQANKQNCYLSVQKEKKQKAPAYRDDINLEKLMALYKMGVSRNKIGETLKCSPNTVKSRLKELGIL